MRICCVGGLGYIGSHLARTLIAAGHTVLGVDSLRVNNLFSVKDERHRRILIDRQDAYNGNGCGFAIADARQYDMLSSLMREFAPEIVVHLAAVAHQDRAQRSPHTAWDHSLRTLENALDIAAHVKARRFVYFSSSTVYGAWPESGVVDETSRCEPLHVYGSLKLCGELATRAVCRANGLEYQIIRPSALYGPGCVSGRVIQRFIERAIDGLPLEVQGGEALDFTFISDLVAGVRLAIESDIADQTWNLTYGKAQPVAEAARLVAEKFGVPVHALNTKGDFPRRGTLSIDKAVRLLRYDPEVDLATGIAKYVTWYLEREPTPRTNREIPHLRA